MPWAWHGVFLLLCVPCLASPWLTYCTVLYRTRQVSDIVKVTFGRESSVFTRQWGAAAGGAAGGAASPGGSGAAGGGSGSGIPPPWRSFSVHLADRTLDFTTPDSDELCCLWAIGLSTLIAARASSNQIDAAANFGVDMGRILWSRLRMRMAEEQASKGLSRQELICEALRMGPPPPEPDL